MNKFLLISLGLSITLFPGIVYADIPMELESESFSGNQQQQGTELTEVELNGLLSAACNNLDSQNKDAVAREIDSEVIVSLSNEKLDTLAETALEIKELPTQERMELCQQ